MYRLSITAVSYGCTPKLSLVSSVEVSDEVLGQVEGHVPLSPRRLEFMPHSKPILDQSFRKPNQVGFAPKFNQMGNRRPPPSDRYCAGHCDIGWLVAMAGFCDTKRLGQNKSHQNLYYFYCEIATYK